MLILSIDTSCDESCVAIVDTDQWKLLADIVHSHIDPMKKWGGVVPEIASREHLKALPLAVQEALKESHLSLKNIDHITVTNRPGLIGALLVGVTYAKSLAFALEKSFSVINHIEGHLYSPYLASFESSHNLPEFPWIALVVSGGHTELFLVKGVQDYQWLGGTIDDAAGEAFDKIGKLLKLDYPQGPKLDRLVKENKNPDYKKYSFPRAKIAPYDFSYSGLKTAVALQIEKEKVLTTSTQLEIATCAQEAILDPLVEKARKAAKEFSVKNIVVTGGVACNSRLREKLPEAYFPQPKHCTDNAAMVACLSALLWKEGKLLPCSFSSTAHPHSNEMFVH